MKGTELPQQARGLKLCVCVQLMNVGYALCFAAVCLTVKEHPELPGPRYNVGIFTALAIRGSNVEVHDDRKLSCCIRAGTKKRERGMNK